MYRLVYLVGVPGSGKTTAFRSLIAAYGRGEPVTIAPGFTVTRYLGGDVAALGTYTGHPFDGTDRLSMGCSPAARQWIASRPAPLVLGEGDRLTARPFFDAARAAGYDVTLIRLHVDDETAAARRLARGASQPGEAWLKGRRTKVMSYTPDVVLDGAQPSVLVARDLAAAVTDVTRSEP